MSSLTWHMKCNTSTLRQGVIRQAFEFAVLLCIDVEERQASLVREEALSLMWFVIAYARRSRHHFRCYNYKQFLIQRCLQVIGSDPGHLSRIVKYNLKTFSNDKFSQCMRGKSFFYLESLYRTFAGVIQVLFEIFQDKDLGSGETSKFCPPGKTVFLGCVRVPVFQRPSLTIYTFPRIIVRVPAKFCE